MRNLTLYLVQADLHWQQEHANLDMLSTQIENTENDSLVILPEMFATGFTMEPEKYACDPDGKPVQWLKEKSIGKAVCGSLSVKENGRYYNRFYWAENGEIKFTYNKKHLFSYGEENLHYTAGTERMGTEYQGWKLLPFICYDLRFPVWCRNTTEADLMLFVANWPTVRISAWEKLLQARAIENQCFVAGVNRVGLDGNGIAHNGRSMVLDAYGNEFSNIPQEAGTFKIILEKEPLEQFRQKFPVLKDADLFELKG